MDIESEEAHQNPLESEKIGIEPAYEWVEKQLENLSEKYDLGKFQKEPRDYQLKWFDKGKRVETLLGQEEIGQEAVGFLAGYVEGELITLTVFADLGEKMARIKKDGHKKETFLEVPRK